MIIPFIGSRESNLQLWMVVRREGVVFQQLVELLEVCPVKGHDGFGLQDALVLVELIAGGQGPEESGEPLDVSALLEDLANAGHLLLSEAKGGETSSAGAPCHRRSGGRRSVGPRRPGR